MGLMWGGHGAYVRRPCSGVSRISAREVLKVRPDTKRGGGVQFVSGPIRKVGRGGVCSSLQVRYEKWEGGVQFASGPIQKVGGGGGGGAVRFKSDTKSGGLCLAHSKYVIVMAEGAAQAPGAPSLDTPLPWGLCGEAMGAPSFSGRRGPG